MARRTLAELRMAMAASAVPDPEFIEELRGDERVGVQALYRRCLARQAARDAELARLEVMLAFEREARENGFKRVAGVDEAGRGPLAGPIVAAAVVLDAPIEHLNDSKQLTAEQREALFERVTNEAAAYGVAIVAPADIDRGGIQAANYRAMAEAAAAVEPPPDYLLVDGFSLPGVTQPCKRLVKGDSRSLSIAAASVLAKVTRDRIMEDLDRECPGYGFAKHKGYGTREHLDAIARLGPSPAHRLSFAPFARKQETGMLFQTTETK